jgi:hypothetical protein
MNAATTLRGMVVSDNYPRRRQSCGNGQSMTPAQNNAHHTITGCKASRGASQHHRAESDEQSESHQIPIARNRFRSLVACLILI